MRVIILGAGQVGSSLAESLVVEKNEVTILDIDSERLANLQARLDLRCMQVSGAHVSSLKDAGASDADILIACMHYDEANLVACKIAKEVFNIPRTIARVREKEFFDYEELVVQHFGVDRLISPERAVSNYLVNLLEYPEALQVLEFAQGRVTLVAIRAKHNSKMVGMPVAMLGKMLPDIDSRIVAIYRNSQPVFPNGETIIHAEDEVFCIADTHHIRKVIRELHQIYEPTRNIIVGGGGKIAERFASEVDHSFKMKIIEPNEERCEELAATLPSRVLVLHGDATDEALLNDENISDMDLYIALTNSDENNILSALLAKNLGARRVIALINRSVYGDLMQDRDIDVAISPSQATISELLKHIRRGDVTSVHTLRRGTAEVLEVVVHGDQKTSKVVGRTVEEIALPGGTVIGALVRNNQVIMAHHDEVIAPNDHLIVFVTNRRLLSKVESIFQVTASFF